MAEYVLDHHLEGERARLALMSRLLDPMHRRHIELLGVGPGARALEVGCGNGSVSVWLAERVGPSGRAVAVDLDLSLVDVRAPGLDLRQGDIVAGPIDPGSFDLVTARAVLHHVTDVEAALRNLVASMAPGGSILLIEPDFLPVSVAEPPEVRAFWDGWLAWSRDQGIDYHVGRKLAPRLAALGLEQVAGTAETAVYNGGSPWANYWTQTVVELRDGLTGSGKLDDRLIDRFLAYCADPGWWTQTIAFTRRSRPRPRRLRAYRRAGRGDDLAARSAGSVILGPMTPSQVSVVGAGHVGSAVANALVLLRVCDRVVLFDRNSERAEGETWDIADAVPLLAEMDIVPSADYADLADSDAVVVTVGATNPPGVSRLQLLESNAEIIASVMRELDRVCPEAIVILVSNPVDVLTRIAIEASTRPAHLVLGSGTVLDGARLRRQLGKLLGVEKEDVHVYVIGEHGDSSFPVWSSATVGAIRLEDCPLPGSTSLLQLKDELNASTRRRGREIHERKGYTSYGIAGAVARIVRAVVRDERRIFMLSVRPAGEYDIGDVVLSVPCVIGRAGVDRQLVLRLSEDEQQSLQRSAEVLDAAYRSLTGTRSKA